MVVEIARFVLTIGDKEISLSVDEARELMRVLMDTFGEKATVKYPADPYRVIKVDPGWPSDPRFPWERFKITCLDGESTTGAKP